MLIKAAAGKAMTRGHRQDYIPCWSKKCDKPSVEYEQTKSEVTTDWLTKLLDEERSQRWINAMEEIYFSHLIRKSWNLSRKLGASQQTRDENSITPNAVASNLFKTSNIKPAKQKNIK